MTKAIDDCVMEIIGIAEGRENFKSKLDEALAFAGRLATSTPHLVEFLKDELMNAATSGRHTPESTRLLCEVRLRLFDLHAANMAKGKAPRRMI